MIWNITWFWDPWWYSILEPDFKERKTLKNHRGKIWRCLHGPSAGPERVCGIRNTAFTHDYHLERIAKSFIESRGLEPFTSDNDDDCPEEGSFREYFIIQMDKSTCQSNNRGVGIFGYPGKPTVSWCQSSSPRCGGWIRSFHWCYCATHPPVWLQRMRCAISFSRKTACSTISLSSLPRAYSERLRLSGERGEYGSPHSAEFLAGTSEEWERRYWSFFNPNGYSSLVHWQQRRKRHRFWEGEWSWNGRTKWCFRSW